MAFDDDIRRLQRAIEEGVEDVVTRTSIAALSAVTLSTPVGNPVLWQNPTSAPPGYVGGRARGNWQLAIGSPPQGETGTTDQSGAPTISKGRSRAFRYRLGPRIFIVNNVPYIGRLNNGHSTQAPAGFVQKAVQAAAREANSGQGIL